MLRFLIFLVAVTGLSACGGGGKLSELDRDYATSDINSWQSLKQYSDGSSVLAFKGVLQSDESIDEPRYLFAVTTDPDQLTATISGAINVELVEANDFNGSNYYKYLYNGTNSEGKSINAEVLGYFLDGADNQVSMTTLVIDLDSERPVGSLLSSGTLVQGLPSGRHSYSGGDAQIIFKGSELEQKYNDMLITIDFDKMKGSMLAETENLFISATNFEIDSSNGTFTGTEGLIGYTGTNNTSEANISGAFSGSNASGIHGLVYTKVGDFASDTCSTCGAGTFYARKE